MDTSRDAPTAAKPGTPGSSGSSIHSSTTSAKWPGASGGAAGGKVCQEEGGSLAEVTADNLNPLCRSCPP